VVSAEGLHIGVLDDVVIDTQGRVVEYALSQVFVEGLVAELNRIPVEMTRSLGEDVLVLDMEGANTPA
jgi:sporulation protein YlmC with PRC-barrel domain